MKKEIYISWCKGLPQDKKALKLVKNSKLIEGIETCQLNEEIDLIKNSGLKVSIHNALRDYQLGLEDKEFKKKMTKEKIELATKCDTSFLGFHAEYKFLFKNPLVILAKIQTILNIKFLRKKTGKKIIFESAPYYPGNNNPERKKVTSPKFIRSLLKYADGYLFDVSHNFITLKNLETEGYSNYEKEILKATKGKVLEMHLNCPSKIDEEYRDNHSIFTGKSYEKEFLEFVKKVLKNNPQIKIINLEMTTNSSPEEHAKIMIQQVKYLKKKLKI
jgi:hypothetical protein